MSGTFGNLKDDFHIEEILEMHAALSDWKNIVGERLAAHSKPVVIKDRVLYVKAEGSAWTQELSFMKREIIRNANAKLGRQLIKDMKFNT